MAHIVLAHFWKMSNQHHMVHPNFELSDGKLVALTDIEGRVAVSCRVPKSLISRRSEKPRIPEVALTARSFRLRKGEALKNQFVFAVLECH
jgi:hypothetical protein